MAISEPSIVYDASTNYVPTWDGSIALSLQTPDGHELFTSRVQPRVTGYNYEVYEPRSKRIACIKEGLRVISIQLLNYFQNPENLRLAQAAIISEALVEVAAAPSRKAASVPTGKLGQRYAVVVGIAKYKSAGERLETLQYADKDARAFRDFLVSPTGGSFTPSNVLLLTNEQATTTEIRRGLFSFLKAAIREDLVVIFFSGHGAADPDRPDNLYLLTYDTDPADIAATAFPMDDVRKALEKTIEAQRVVVLADACHSGGVAGEMRTKGVQLGATNEAMNRYWSQLSQTSPGRVIFTSSESGEVSQESGKWGQGHGVFTWALLEGLKGSADYDADGIVTLGEALRFTDEQVRRETRSAQHPTIAGDQYDPNLPMGVVK